MTADEKWIVKQARIKSQHNTRDLNVHSKRVREKKEITAQKDGCCAFKLI